MANGNGNGHSSEKTLQQVQGKKYKFLFVSWEALSGDLAWQIQKEGHEVKCYIKNVMDEYDGFLEKVSDWKEHVDWADVIVFDDTGFGAEADRFGSKAGIVKDNDIGPVNMFFPVADFLQKTVVFVHYIFYVAFYLVALF